MADQGQNVRDFHEKIGMQISNFMEIGLQRRCFSSIYKKSHAIWRSRTSKRALEMCQPNHHELPRKKINRG
jgi:hypothetical protein